MTQFPDHGINDPDRDAADAQGLLAGTLALMTGQAQACCEGQRALMAKKIVANLLMLSRHPGAPPNFRAIAANLHPMWVRLLQQGPDQPQPGPAPTHRSDFDIHRVLWHTTSETLQ